MALSPAACDPNRKTELERIKKTANSENGKEKVKQDFNIDLDDKTDIKVKETESKSEPTEKSGTKK